MSFKFISTVAAKEGSCSVFVQQSVNKGRFGTCCPSGVDPVYTAMVPTGGETEISRTRK